MEFEKYTDGLRERATPFIDEWLDKFPDPNEITDENIKEMFCKVMDNMNDVEKHDIRKNSLLEEKNIRDGFKLRIHQLEEKRNELDSKEDSEQIEKMNTEISKSRGEILFMERIISLKEDMVRESEKGVKFLFSKEV